MSAGFAIFKQAFGDAEVAVNPRMVTAVRECTDDLEGKTNIYFPGDDYSCVDLPFHQVLERLAEARKEQ